MPFFFGKLYHRNNRIECYATGSFGLEVNESIIQPIQQLLMKFFKKKADKTQIQNKTLFEVTLSQSDYPRV
jgi:hypothetical protein